MSYDLMSIDLNNLPSHIAITMDGNGRWAKQKGLLRTAGHDAGLTVAKNIVKAAAEIGIKNLTLYVFSTENWKRTEKEVGFLMNLIHKHLLNELNFYESNKIRINHVGDISGLPKSIQDDLIKAKEITKNYNNLTLNLAINYGGRDEIIRGFKKIVYNNIDCEKINESLVSSYLDIPDSPDVDLLIRTGGEKRLSNFLLWHISYAELIFKNTLWPDYSVEEFYSDIEEYQKRNRRYGAETATQKS